MKTECVADIAMNSVLAEYNRELYEQYGLLMVDTSYGTGNPSIKNLEDHLRHYAEKNFERSTAGGILNAQTMTAMYCKDVKISGYSVATDNNGAVLNRQILAYMAGEPIGYLMGEVSSNASSLQSGGLDSTDVDALASENQEIIDSTELPEIEKEDGKKEIISIGNPADVVNSQRGIGALNLALPDKSGISESVCSLSEYASHRNLNKGTGLDDQMGITAVQKLILDQYYYEKCSRYGAEMDKAQLKYQLEYLIYGLNSDYGNLEKMAETLLFWRQASNMIYLFSCQEKVSEAEAIATALSVILFVPELADAIKYSILFAWTFAESISDLHILFSGGRVPLFKSDETWKLSLSNMFSFRDHLGSQDNQEGLLYEDYLRIKLLMTSHLEKTKRMMDIMEMDIRQTEGNAGFKLDYCVDVFRAQLEVGTKYGYEVGIERIYGYER
ncbi:DUF5702 domain-containing protein [Butyrivibrio sp. XBB1001]|uniref:DUF5702 domain-containing protein n=1 Tax=Butyrivibrio sp. XBB1001 TaxID=1280682 RepID=UPI0012DC285D|nr:DUF5702 domain-containing protein [Butyrivibrio sp. XBB1001]